MEYKHVAEEVHFHSKNCLKFAKMSFIKRVNLEKMKQVEGY